jgi:asparagine synthase (glutamine-hydrolysing)
MSVFFGIWNVTGGSADRSILTSADISLAPYAPDGLPSHYVDEQIAISYHAFHTTAESRGEQQPFISRLGSLVVWDGRLDNRKELIAELGAGLSPVSTDVQIVAAAFDRWETGSFSRLLGDWAISVWLGSDRRLILARDFAGLRPLYYMRQGDQIRWSSLLEPLVTLSKQKFVINQAFVAGWLGMYPSTNVTPYVGIHGVPACSFVELSPQKTLISKYWDFDPKKHIHYRSNAEYEEHFRIVFRQAVQRRLRTDSPICAELSGGMDSPSITCMADLIAASSPDIPEIHTLSFYDDTEPHADERPYFTKVEEQRGRTGCHIDTANRQMFGFSEDNGFIDFPSAVDGGTTELEAKISHFLESNRIRVVLSGTGGDEMTGGVPSPLPELQDLVARVQLRGLAHKLKLWSLHKRKPWFHLLGEAIAGFLPTALVPVAAHQCPVPWLKRDFVSHHKEILSGFNGRVRVFGPLPSLQANLDGLEVLRRQLSNGGLPKNPAYEKRYPFLDRDLADFLFAVPREQVLVPGYRRSLMRRALAGIVPAEILERRRKAYAGRGLRVAISREWNALSQLLKNMMSEQFGFVDQRAFSTILEAIENNDRVPLVALSRTITLEVWLRNICRNGVLADNVDSGRSGAMVMRSKRLSQLT